MDSWDPGAMCANFHAYGFKPAISGLTWKFSFRKSSFTIIYEGVSKRKIHFWSQFGYIKCLFLGSDVFWRHMRHYRSSDFGLLDLGAKHGISASGNEIYGFPHTQN